MENWRIQAVAVIGLEELAGRQVDGNGLGQLRVGSVMKARIGQEREPRGIPAELDHVEVVADAVCLGQTPDDVA